jgi:hypothetical protein
LLLQDFQFVGGAPEDSNNSGDKSAGENAEHSVETEIAGGDVQEIADQTLSY